MVFGKLTKADKAKLALTSKSTDEEVRKAYKSGLPIKWKDTRPVWRLREFAKLRAQELSLVGNKSKLKVDLFVLYDTEDQYLPAEKEIKEAIKFTKHQLKLMEKSKWEPHFIENVKFHLENYKKQLKEFKEVGNSKPRYSKYSQKQITAMLQSPEMFELLGEASKMAQHKKSKYKFQFTKINSVVKMSKAWLTKRDLWPDGYPKAQVFKVSCTITLAASPKKQFVAWKVIEDISRVFMLDFNSKISTVKHLTQNFKRRVYRGQLLPMSLSTNIDPIYNV